MGQDPDVDMHSADGPVAHAVTPEGMYVSDTVSYLNDVLDSVVDFVSDPAIDEVMYNIYLGE